MNKTEHPCEKKHSVVKNLPLPSHMLRKKNIPLQYDSSCFPSTSEQLFICNLYKLQNKEKRIDVSMFQNYCPLPHQLGYLSEKNNGCEQFKDPLEGGDIGFCELL